MNLKKIKNISKDIQFLKLIDFIKLLYIYIYTMGLSESSLTTITKPFSFINHCKVSCDSPCCTKLCGRENQCVFNIGTHESVNSDSGEDEDTDKKSSK